MKLLTKDKFKEEFEIQYHYCKGVVDVINNGNKRLKETPSNDSIIKIKEDQRVIWDDEEETYSVDSIGIMLEMYKAFKNSPDYEVKDFEHYILSMDELEEIWNNEEI